LTVLAMSQPYSQFCKQLRRQMRTVRNNPGPGAPVADATKMAVASWLLPSTFGGTRYHHQPAELPGRPSISTRRNGSEWQLADLHPLSLHLKLAQSCPSPACEKLERQDASTKDLSMWEVDENQ
jgi:hypothetical protein